MASSLRQRRGRDDDEGMSANNNVDHELEIFAQQYNAAVRGSGRGALALRGRVTLFIIVAIIICIILAIIIVQCMSSDAAGSSIMRKDLKIVTVYPHSVLSSSRGITRIGELEGQTELLVTDDNREAVNAIRTSIGMANNLQYNGRNKEVRRRRNKRRKGGVIGVLLGVSNFIASYRQEEEKEVVEGRNKRLFVAGDIALESFDEVKMRSYLVEHGGKCSHDQATIQAAVASWENTALLRYDEITTSMTTTNDHELMDALWTQALHLFAFCQFANGDARGYVAHGTFIKPEVSAAAHSTTTLQEMLEEARSTGTGIATITQFHDVSQAMENNSVHSSPLFVIPHGTASRDMARKILSFLFVRPTYNNISPMHSNSLLFEISEEWLRKWDSIQIISNVEELHETDDVGAASWLFLESIVGKKRTTSELRWLARHCQNNEHCSYVTNPSDL